MYQDTYLEIKANEVSRMKINDLEHVTETQLAFKWRYYLNQNLEIGIRGGILTYKNYVKPNN